jgi:hypothetical protein
MALTRIDLSISGEVLIEYFAGFDVGDINQTPPGMRLPFRPPTGQQSNLMIPFSMP